MSDFFEWDSTTYGLNVPDMDREHEKLIGYMNVLHRLHESKASRQALAPALDDLLNYTRHHFADEEAYTARIGFRDSHSHGLIHKQLLERLGQFEQEFQKSGMLTQNFFFFLRMWLKAHIRGIDIKYTQQPG
jgi:hemerythrin-like metal-binding protein